MLGRPHDGAWPVRGYGLALTIMLHLLIVAALLYRTHTARIERPAAQPSVITLKLLSAAPQTASIAAPPAPTPPRVRRAKTLAPPHPSPVTVPPVAPETPVASTSAPPAAVTQLAAAPPADVEPDMPPPLEYLRRISRMIALAQHYPWSAIQYGHEGDVIMRMHLSRSGAVLAVTLIRSSGHASLDAEARDVIWRIGKFPPFPFDYLPRIGEFDIDQPITFRHYMH